MFIVLERQSILLYFLQRAEHAFGIHSINYSYLFNSIFHYDSFSGPVGDFFSFQDVYCQSTSC